MKRRIKSIDLMRMFWRCFLIQGSWNYKALIGMGFCFSALPIAKRLYKTPEEHKEFIHRHLAFFNAHPYFASWCLGAVAKLEEEAIENNWDSKYPISIFKERLTGPLGSVGDQFFWNGLKPLTAGVGVLLALIIGWYALIVFFILYNVPHVYIRLKGLLMGYKKGFDIVSNIAVQNFRVFITTITVLGTLVAGFYSIVAGKWSYDQNHYLFVVFAVSVLTTLVFLDIQKPVWIALSFSVLFSIVVKIIFIFTF